MFSGITVSEANETLLRKKGNSTAYARNVGLAAGTLVDSGACPLSLAKAVNVERRFSQSLFDNVMFDDIAPSASRFGESFKILLRWRGSIYRLIWEPFLIYMTAYILISVLYDFLLDDNARSDFEAIAAYCSKYSTSLPIILLLGFFTSTSMQRWFSVMNTMPGTAKVIAIFVLSLKENVPDGAQMIRQYARWILLSWTFTFRLVCRPLKKLYPNLESLQNAGLLLEHERIQLEQVQARHSSESDHYLSLAVLDWNLSILKRCSRQGHFMIPADCNRQVDALMTFKKSCCNTLKFSAKNIPVALIQVVTITVYSIGVASLMARQLADKNRATSFITGYFPILNTFQYFLYLSWLKFGAMASNPFGEDDDDIDIKKLLQSHMDDAERLQQLYISNPTDELVQTSIESPTDKLPFRVDGLTTNANKTDIPLTKITVKNGSNTTATTGTTSQPASTTTVTSNINVSPSVMSDLTNRTTEEIHQDTENNSTSATSVADH